MGLGHVPAGPFREAGQGDDVPRRQHRGAGGVDEPLSWSRHAVARWGESVAAEHVAQRGFNVTGRNVRVGRAELDLVALDPRGVPVVFEVKTVVARHPDDDPVSRADSHKLAVVRRAARRLDPPAARVDVIGISIRADGVTLRWVRAADW